MESNLRLPSNKLEMMILGYCCLNVSFFLNIKSYLDTSKQGNKSYFEDEKNQRIFNIMCRFFDKYKRFLVKETFKAIIEKLKDDSDMKFLYNSIIDKIYSFTMEEIDPEFLEYETKEFIKETKAYEAILLAQIDIEERNFSNMIKRIEEATRINFDKDLGLSIRNVEEGLERIRMLDKEAKIPTGFPNLDSIIDGGLHSKEIICFSGIPGSYKTGVLGNIALNCFLKNKKVLVYTFETSAERLSMRYFQNLAEMNKQEIILDEDTMKQRVNNAYSLTTGDLIIKEYNTNTACSNDLMAHINELWMYEKWKPDLVVVDYILIMRTNDRTLSSSESYKYYKIVTEELRNIAKSLYIPVLTACQVNRGGMSDRGGSKAMVTAKDVSESRGILDTVDIFIDLIQTSNDKKKNNLIFYVEKNRNERSGIRIQYDVDYSHHKLTERGILSG